MRMTTRYKAVHPPTGLKLIIIEEQEDLRTEVGQKCTWVDRDRISVDVHTDIPHSRTRLIVQREI